MPRSPLAISLLMLMVSMPVRAVEAPLAHKVVGTQLQNSRGERVRLRGVNTACLEWTSDGEGHILDTVKTAIRDWHVNHIRVPLSQDRWFGKGPEQKGDSRAYRALVQQVVDACASAGCYVILDLHWSDAGEWGKRIGQHKMPDQNSVAFWKDFAVVYKNHPAVLFDLYNEPHSVTWDVWLNGGEVKESDRRTGDVTYQAVGMQALLDTVRATGARNVVIAGGLDWSYDLAGILKGPRLSDPEGNGVIYANHAYPFKGDTVERWVTKMEAAAKELPLVVTEFGSERKGGAGLSGEKWVRRVLQALEQHEWAWTAWDMHPGAAPCLVSDWKYTPTPYFGVLVQQVLLGHVLADPPPTPVGMFDSHDDVGEVPRAGSVTFDAPQRAYTISGGGANMWAARDAFHYAWKRASGDLTLAADVAFQGTGKDPHRKACLVIRQTLDDDSPYADVALHGDGLTSLQFRETKGAQTHEVRTNLKAPRRLSIQKRGKYVSVLLSAELSATALPAAAVRLTFEEPFYIGLGVCAHDREVMETAVFSNVELTAPLPTRSGRPTLYSSLETLSVASHDRRVISVRPGRIEAPNWSRDGKSLLFNGDGRIFRIPIAGGTPEPIDTGPVTRCNNDHGISPDGTLLAISGGTAERRQSLIYTLPINGGTPTLVTPTGPSYWHGWSPDGKTLAYCAERSGEFDIYTIPVVGGAETRLTTAKGLDDGPEYAPDGKWIYFNSVRTGLMQIWRMRTDGSDQQQVTDDAFNNWFPHPSPDGKSLVFLSYEKDVIGHPENKDVTLRMMTLDGKAITVLARFFGGQGTINVPSWSPDGKNVALVTYQLAQ